MVLQNASIEAHLNALPYVIRNAVHRDLTAFSENSKDLGLDFNRDSTFNAALIRVWAASQFVADYCVRNPLVLKELLETGDLSSKDIRETYSTKLCDIDVENEEHLNRQLRKFRNYQMIRIAWRDISGSASLEDTLLDLSYLAEACLQKAIDYLYQAARLKYGTPLLSNGEPQQLVVLGMGKLGAWELNFSSDIDLIFAFQEDGDLVEKRVTTNAEFFTRLCRSLIRSMGSMTEEGFVFRVDVRLRPFGESGPLVMSFSAFEQYYQSQARDWERYAMIKARAVAGDLVAGAKLEKILHPFIYRRYLDYGAFSELRSLKSKISRELQRNDRLDNIKLGPGGIREIEFIGQAFQLIRGGRDPVLQDRRILKILTVLGERSLLPKTTVEKLKQGYQFLRTVENRLQEYGDKQVHDLPILSDQRSRLAISMGYSTWEGFKLEIDAIRDQVQGFFEQVFELPQSENEYGEAEKIWAATVTNLELYNALQAIGYREYEDACSTIRAFRDAKSISRLGTKAAKDLDSLMPMLIRGVGAVDDPEKTLKRILGLIEAIAGRSAYLALLVENPLALSQLIKLAAASTWVVAYISRYPLLLDELLDVRSLYAPLSKEHLIGEIQDCLDRVDSADFERVMAELRHFKQAHMLRVAAADTMRVISVDVVSDYLTDIAEITLLRVLTIAWGLVTAKHGVPPGANPDKVSGFGIIGYGKLGGIELGYGSDLDLVFLFESKNSGQLTDGDKPISCAQFYLRLGQRLINILATKMLAGVLYEVDMRLRPSGNSGFLVSNIDAFDLYQHKDAWTWEHQALVRARFVAGDSRIEQKFKKIRRSVLVQERDPDVLRNEVRDMRERMRTNLVVKDPGTFDLKQGVGGIVDIEFIVQFGTLLHAGDNPALVKYTGTTRLLDTLAQLGFVDEQNAGVLKEAYFLYRDCSHRFSLQAKSAVVSDNKFKNLRAQVERIWLRLME